MKNKKLLRRQRLKRRIRGKISGSSVRPRLSVYKSNREIYAQLVDDISCRTLLAASSKEKSLSTEIKGKSKTEQAKIVGTLLAKKAIEKGIKEAVFDRNGFLYHGRVKALAEGARAAGLKF